MLWLVSGPGRSFGPEERNWCQWLHVKIRSLRDSGNFKVMSNFSLSSPKWPAMCCFWCKEVCAKLKFFLSSLYFLHFAVSHRNRSLAMLEFFVVDTSHSGGDTPSASRLASLYPTISLCSVSASSSSLSSCHHEGIPPCHKTSWSSLSPDPKSEFSFSRRI